jgi:diguanylate cyclase (GGDEF)-like protein/PAS domain S-box-containing protein
VKKLVARQMDDALRRETGGSVASPAPAGERAEGADSVPLSADDYGALLERAHAGVMVVQRGIVRYMNAIAARMHGYSVAEVTTGALDVLALVAPTEHARVLEQVRRRRAGELGALGDECELRLMRKDGSSFQARIVGTHMKLGGRSAELVTVTDISEVVQATHTAERRARMLAAAEQLALLGSAEVDLATGAMAMSDGLVSLFGEAPVDGTVGVQWLLDRIPADDQEIVRRLWKSASPGDLSEVRHRIRHCNGSLRFVTHCRALEADGDSEPVRAVIILRDVTDEWRAARRIDRLTNYDQATALPNRSALRGWLSEAVQRAAREPRQFVLLLIDIAQYKILNETLGDAAGEALRKGVAARLSSMRGQDALAYVGGGAFAILMARATDVGEDEAMQLARAVIAGLAPPLEVQGSEVYVSPSVGIAAFPSDADDAETLLQHAHAATHTAHQLGANQICFYTPEANARVAARLGMETRLRRAIERDELFLVYQPQVDLSSGEMIGAEALVRWRDPAGGIVSPGDFIPLAEETGLILSIGEWVLRTACVQARTWMEAGHPLRVGVNLSGRQLQQPDLAHRIQAILLETGADPRCLGLEITESMLVENIELAARTLGELKSIGVEISIDDFGTGYSNLGHLRTLPIDAVKIDRSFVHDVTAAPEDVSITRAVITMAHSMQLRVIAEGVETEGQLSLLVANRCDQIQGYYFSAPVLAEDITTMLGEGKRVAAHLLDRELRERTLLLVDDEDNIVASVKRLLRKSGYKIVTANSGAQGLQRLAEHSVDVIVSDQRMPGMTGVEFLRRAKELYPETVRIVLSGYTELQSITDAVNEGAIYKFLTKPWDDELLRKHIEEAFTQKGLADENQQLGEQVRHANRELAQVNGRLQQLLAQQREQISREEARVSVAREVLENIPAPVIGFDLDGMIAFLNAGSQAMFPGAVSMLGCDAAEVLPESLVNVWRSADGEYHTVHVGDAAYLVVCRAMSGSTGGKLLVLVPAVACAIADSATPVAMSSLN